MLSTKPCCADFDCLQKAAASTERSDKAPVKEKECPGCSPFVTCGSCAGFIISKPITFNAIAFSEAPVTKHDGYQQPSIEDVSLAIWQPPKIS